MRGDGAAIERRSGFYAAMSFAVSFHHSPSTLGRYYLNRTAIAWGMAFMRQWPYRRTSDFLFLIVLFCTSLL